MILQIHDFSPSDPQYLFFHFCKIMNLHKKSKKKSAEYFLSQNHDFGAPKSRMIAVDFFQIHQNHDFVKIHVRANWSLVVLVIILVLLLVVVVVVVVVGSSSSR